MCVRAVARGAIVVVTAAFLLASAHANEAAHRMAEKFAGATGADKTQEPEPASGGEQKPAAEPAEAAAKRGAERKAEEARKEAARKQAEARRAAQAKRRAAAKAAVEARLAAERLRADEMDMLARARREAQEMQAAAEEARLTEEARRLIQQAEQERAKAEELLAGEATAPGPAQAASEPRRAGGDMAERLALERAQKTRRLVVNLNRVRRIRKSRLANQARRERQVQRAAAGAPPPSPAAPSPAPQVAARATEPPPAAAALQEEAVAPVAPSPPAKADPPTKGEAIATAPPVPPPAPQGAAAAPPFETPAAAASSPDPRPPQIAAAAPRAVPSPPQPEIKPSFATAPSRVAVLLAMAPGTYGIRRGGAKVADPVLCLREGCYISAGADHPAMFLPGRKALGFANTWGARAGACRNALGCVFRGVELGPLPAFLQPVDLHIFKHDRRAGFAVLADSDCSIAAGRLVCRHGIEADDYTMWVVPESLAQTLGPAGLQRALTDGLNGPRSAALMPR